MADKPIMGLRPERAVALETLQLCAGFRERLLGPVGVMHAGICRGMARTLEIVLPPPPVVLAAVAVALCARRPDSRRSYNPMADLSDDEYKRRYELGRRRYYAERAAKRAFRQAWLREHGPWLLLAVIAILLVVVLGLTQPHRFIVVMSLALYSVLAWVVCWAVRASY